MEGKTTISFSEWLRIGLSDVEFPVDQGGNLDASTIQTVCEESVSSLLDKGDIKSALWMIQNSKGVSDAQLLSVVTQFKALSCLEYLMKTSQDKTVLASSMSLQQNLATLMKDLLPSCDFSESLPAMIAKIMAVFKTDVTNDPFYNPTNVLDSATPKRTNMQSLLGVNTQSTRSANNNVNGSNNKSNNNNNSNTTSVEKESPVEETKVAPLRDGSASTGSSNSTATTRKRPRTSLPNGKSNDTEMEDLSKAVSKTAPSTAHKIQRTLATTRAVRTFKDINYEIVETMSLKNIERIALIRPRDRAGLLTIDLSGLLRLYNLPPTMEKDATNPDKKLTPDSYKWEICCAKSFLPNKLPHFRVNSNGNFFIAGMGGDIHIFSVDRGQRVVEVRVEATSSVDINQTITQVCFNPLDNNKMALGSYHGYLYYKDNKDSQSLHKIKIPTKHTEPICSMEFKKLASPQEDPMLYITSKSGFSMFNLNTSETVYHETFSSVKYDPVIRIWTPKDEGDPLVVFSVNKELKVFNPVENQVERVIELHESVTDFCFKALDKKNFQICVSHGDHTISFVDRHFNLESGQLVNYSHNLQRVATYTDDLVVLVTQSEIQFVRLFL